MSEPAKKSEPIKRYDPKAIEPKWQQVWADTKLYAARDNDPSREKYYYLAEFPYPSGEGLHVGHVLSYTALDIMARHKRMQGFNVLYPMGFDEFGLPTENYAIKHKIAPQVATERNVANFRRQFKSLGLSFDWDREVRTSDPNYYKWTQWIFLQLYKKGLAYQAELPINWCPFEKTGLANEEVVDGKHERCGTPVEKKLIKQWVLKITAYADRLAEDLKSVDYLDRVATQQINWIGRSEGAEIDFKINDQTITVYTTRPDTLAGATFLVLAPEHPAVAHITTPAQKTEVDAYIKRTQAESEVARQETDRPKTGVFTGTTAKNPITGADTPIWIADYVLAGYGTGAIMAVPAHDQRDHDFAQAFNLPIIPVIEPVTGTPHGNDHEKEAIVAVVRNPKTNETLMLDWGPRQQNWGGMLFIGGGVEPHEKDLIEVAKREIAEETGYTDVKFIRQTPVPVNNYYYSNVKDRHDKARMHGLLFELQSNKQDQTQLDEGEKNKFTPTWIPNDKVAATVNDDGHALIHRLLEDHIVYTGDGPLINSSQFDGLANTEAKRAVTKWLQDQGAGRAATKYKIHDWIFSRQHYWGEPIPIIHCPKDGAVPVPEDQLPVKLPEVDHYEPTDTGESPLATIPEFVNTTCPKCGGPAKRETDTMPNWAGSSWYYLRYTDPHNDQEFAAQDKIKYWTPVDLYNGGMEHTTLHLLYSRFWHKFLYDQGLVPTPEPYAKRISHGMILGPDGVKMSKSRGNVINPDHVIEQYGADTIRLYEMFMGPFDEQKVWSEEHLNGVSRFIYRIWTWAQDMIATGNLPRLTEPAGDLGIFETEVDRITHKTLKKVHHDIGNMQFNTAVSALMEYINFLTKQETKTRLLQPDAHNVRERTLRTLILMLAPFTPHLTEELWHELGETDSVHASSWSKYDLQLIKDELITIVVQVNGKVRANLVTSPDATDEALTDLAQADPNVAKYLTGGKIVKTIVVPRKLVNFVVKPNS